MGLPMRAAAMAGGVAVVLAASACGGGSSGGNTSSSDGGSSSASGPVKVLFMDTLTSTTLGGFPQQVTAIKARFKAVNDAGGVNGHQIQLDVCDTKGDPNVAVQCAQKASGNTYAAVLGGIELNGEQTMPLFEKSKIAYLNTPFTPAEYTSKYSFPVTGGLYTPYIGLGEAMVKNAGCKKVDSIAQNNAGAEASADFVKQGVTQAGGTWGKTHITPSVADYSAVASTVKSGGADCMVINFAPQDAVKVFGAMKQTAPSIKIGATSASLPPPLIAALGNAANGTYLVDQLYPVNGNQPGVQQFKSEMTAAGANSKQIDSLAMQAWTVANVFTQAAKQTSGAITKSSLFSALNSASSIDPGTTATLNFTKENPTKGFNRIFNTSYLVETITNGQYALVTPSFVSLSS